tara:strand:+ start:4582 stop:4920 length:339 start_codon:yes stop_codon:yes gene_type:complete
LKIHNKELIIGLAAAVLMFFLLLLGIPGIRTILGAFLCFFLPFYLIIDNFELETGEKIIFSFFIGVVFFSSLVYYLGILLGSVRIAIVVSFLLLTALGIFIRKFIRSSKPRA